MSQSSKLDVHPFEVIFRHFVRYMPVSKHRKICQAAEALLRACLSLFRISICSVYSNSCQILLKQCECALMAEFAQLLEPLLTAQVIGHVDATLAHSARCGYLLECLQWAGKLVQVVHLCLRSCIFTLFIRTSHLIIRRLHQHSLQLSVYRYQIVRVAPCIGQHTFR